MRCVDLIIRQRDAELVKELCDRSLGEKTEEANRNYMAANHWFLKKHRVLWAAVINTGELSR